MAAKKNEKLSAALKAKWASGTRKPNPRSTYEKSSATMKRKFAEGQLFLPKNSPEQCRQFRLMADPEKMAAINRRIGIQRRGALMPPGPSARGEGHWKARYWELLSPDRQVYRFVNLNEFIRANSHLFDPADLEWKRARCRASKGIRQLFQSRRAPLSWKGWRAVKSLSKEDIVAVVHGLPEPGTYPSSEMGEDA